MKSTITILILLLAMASSASAAQKPVKKVATAKKVSSTHKVTPAKKTVVVKDQDIVNLIAATLYLEAGGEVREGRIGVASVIWNRAGGSKEKLPKVILARKQFSCWNNRNLASFKPPKNSSYEYCVLVAKDMVNGSFVPPAKFKNATFYHETTVSPEWRKHLHLTTQVGNHIFYTKETV